MALANRPGYWKETNDRQAKQLSDYQKSGGKDKIRLRNMRSDIKYSAGMNKPSIDKSEVKGIRKALTKAMKD